MRLLMPAVAAVLLVGCVAGDAASGELALLHQPAVRPLLSLQEREVRGIVTASETRTTSQGIVTCVVVRGSDGTRLEGLCFPGGRDGDRARRVSGFPWLNPGDAVRLRARRVDDQWQVVQNTVTEADHAGGGLQVVERSRGAL